MAKKHSQPKKKETELIPGRKEWTFPALIFIFAFLLYSNTLRHGFVMDDGAVVTTHTVVQKGFAGIKELFGQSSVFGSTKENFGTYRPLTMSFFAIENQFFGNSATAYHFIHVLLYAVLCVVLFLLLKTVLKDYHPLLPLVSVLIFVAHPVHTEVAANIKSADEMLSLLFCSLSLMFAIRSNEISAEKNMVFSFLFFLGALFSKESAATFFLVVPLALSLSTSASKKNIFTIAAIHFSAIVIYLLARNAALDKAPENITVINNALAGAHSLAERYATISIYLFDYLKLLFFPYKLCWDYGYNQIPLVNFSNPVAIISLLIYLSMGIFSLLVIFKPATFTPSNFQPFKLLSFCILFYIFSLSVSTNIFVIIGATMAERFLFTPSLAFCIVIAYLFLTYTKAGTNYRSLFTSYRSVPIYILLALFSIKTFSRNKDWKNNLTLFAQGVMDGPDSYRTNITYAWESVLAGQVEQDPVKKKEYLENAVTYYQKGLAIYDQNAPDWYNYGVSNSNLGNLDEAIKAYDRALAIDPQHKSALYNAATAQFSRKDYTASLKYFLQAYSVDPDFMDVSFKVGIIYHMTGNIAQSIPYYERFVAKNPNNKDVVTNLMLAYKSTGNMERSNYYLNVLNSLGEK